MPGSIKCGAELSSVARAKEPFTNQHMGETCQLRLMRYSKIPALFDDIVGAREHCRRDCEALRFSRLEVHDKL